MLSYQSNLAIGGQHLRSVFLVDLSHICKGTAAVCFLSRVEDTSKAVSITALLVVKEEPKEILPVLIVEV